LKSKLPEPPPDWGNDQLTQFIDRARENTFATFHNQKSDYERLSKIDGVFCKIRDNLNNSKDYFAAFFLIRSHASYLAAMQLLLAGQIAEVYACLRLSLENALYAFHLTINKDAKYIWLSRHKGDEQKKKVRKEFKIGNLIQTLKKANTVEGVAAENLYEHTIDFGAHPNELGLFQGLKHNKEGTKHNYRIAYLHHGDSEPAVLAFRISAQIGVCSLGIYQMIFRERFDILGLSEILQGLRKGL
jgi:hypothetical protein